jgi:hypothetical protein
MIRAGGGSRSYTDGILLKRGPADQTTPETGVPFNCYTCRVGLNALSHVHNAAGSRCRISRVLNDSRSSRSQKLLKRKKKVLR